LFCVRQLVCVNSTIKTGILGQADDD